MSDFNLGDRVTFTHGLHRLTEAGMRKAWLPHPNEEVATTPKEGVIVGKRSLSNGRVFWAEEGYTQYTMQETFNAYLIAYDLRRKPVYVRPEHIQPMLADAGETK